MAGAIGILSAVFVDSVLFGTRLIVHFPLSELLGSVPQTLSVKKVVTTHEREIDAASTSVV